MNKDQKIMTADELDTIGEIMNISMGAAATAVSTMLERQVVITTPQISQGMLKNVDVSALEPAIVVKISYVEGVRGKNMIMLKRNDMRIILDLLMGNDEAGGEDDFEFDEMSMSAASEVMNQMMGASATALSELLNKSINISTPQAQLVETAEEALRSFSEIEAEENVLAISFKMTIKETLDTTFTSVMPIDFTREIVKSLNGQIDTIPEEEPVNQAEDKPMRQPVPQPAPQPAIQPTQQPAPQPAIQPTQQTAPQPAIQPTQQSAPQPATQPTQQIPQQAPPQQMNMPPQYMQQPPIPPQAPPAPYQQPYQQPMDPSYQQNLYAQQMQYQQQYMHPHYPGGQYPQYNIYQDPQQPVRYPAPMINVKQAEFPEFANKSNAASPYGSNMNMLMGVQLDVAVIVGRTKEKIKDVLDFGQGSVIELDKQTGAPAEVVVNGQLLAYGDVVVVGDNFGVRITEIVGTKELLDSLETKK